LLGPAVPFNPGLSVLLPSEVVLSAVPFRAVPLRESVGGASVRMRVAGIDDAPDAVGGSNVVIVVVMVSFVVVLAVLVELVDVDGEGVAVDVDD
jgi:hypothetical protein